MERTEGGQREASHPPHEPGTSQGRPEQRGEPEAVHYLPRPELGRRGNRVAVLRDGGESFPAMLSAIGAARRSVHLETYIYADDATGRRFADALTAAARRGVEVALLYDAFGSWRTRRSLFVALERAGVLVLAYKPLAPWRRGWGWTRRDHRKLLVIDGAIGFTGGINIGDPWAHEDDGGAAWRDTMVRVVGPAAAELDGLFLDVWERERRRQRRGARLPAGRSAGPLEPADPASLEGELADACTWIVGNREFARRRSIRRAYRHAIARAGRYVFISNPYFVPDGAILRSLRAARRRGVRVALILPGRSDVRAVQLASRATYERLLSWGVEIWEWARPVFHAKTAVIDGAWSTIGTYNLDTQSLRYNLEVTAVFASRAVGERLERMFLGDLAGCRPVELARWRRRPLLVRLLERLCYALRAWL